MSSRTPTRSSSVVPDSSITEHSYKDIVRSKIFYFYIGKDHVPMPIHSAPAIWASEHLRTMITGDMKEAREGSCTMTDVEVEVFARFAEWLYRGDYTPPEPEIFLSAEDIAAEEVVEDIAVEAMVEEGVNEFVYPVDDPALSIQAIEESFNESRILGVGAKKKSKKKTSSAPKTKTQEPLKASQPLNFWLPPTRAGPAESSARMSKTERAWKEFKRLNFAPAPTAWPRAAPAADESHAEVFLCQAKLYVLADKFLIEPLKLLVLEKLHSALVNFHAARAAGRGCSEPGGVCLCQHPP
ncbi:MAG: hypothetical protein M1829_002666 [Trizodia sp. TS-e1964]|nr:MAG: hypothetical protein M1829_002666 [Trizodia sp. TS-e1964]